MCELRKAEVAPPEVPEHISKLLSEYGACVLRDDIVGGCDKISQAISALRSWGLTLRQNDATAHHPAHAVAPTPSLPENRIPAPVNRALSWIRGRN